MRQLRLLVLIALGLNLVGCPPRNPDGPAIVTPPVETVTVDAGNERPDVGSVMVGLSRTSKKQANEPETPAWLDRLLKEPAPLLVTLSDAAKFDGKFPGEKGNWKKWDETVEAAFRKHADRQATVQWEVWNEPDQAAKFKGSQADYFAMWVRTAQLLKRLDSRAVLVGPSSSSHGWVQEFLKVAKEYEVLPDIVCWHEDGNKADIAGHLNSSEESFWQDGTAREHIRVMQTTSSAQKYVPGDMVILMSGIREARRQVAWRGLKEELAIKVHHLMTDDGKPRAIMKAMELVSELNGTLVKVDKTDTVQGVAAKSIDGKSVEIVLGRARLKTGADPKLVEVKMVVKGLKGDIARVGVMRLANGGAAPAMEMTPAMEREVEVKNGEAKFAMPEFARGEVMVVKLETRKATTKPATRPAVTMGGGGGERLE